MQENKGFNPEHINKTVSKIYIPDIHGNLKLLESVKSTIEKEYGADHPPLVFLGDLVDRGAESKEVLERVSEILASNVNNRYILGNHDEWMYDALMKKLDVDEIQSWLNNGGVTTLHSYARDKFEKVNDFVAELNKYGNNHDDFTKYLNNFLDEYVVSDKLMSLFDNAYHMDVNGGFIGVHAGVNPYKSLETQNGNDLRWIRTAFLNYVDDNMPAVIHGHTIMDRPTVTENRISLDVGSYGHSPQVAICHVDADNKEMNFFVVEMDGRYKKVTPKRELRATNTIWDEKEKFFDNTGRLYSKWRYQMPMP